MHIEFLSSRSEDHIEWSASEDLHLRDAGSRRVLHLPILQRVMEAARGSAEENTFSKRKCTLRKKSI